MGIRLGVKINEKATKTFTASFFDELDAPVVPTSVTWTWADNNGTVINSRQDVVETPATVVDITLNDLDTALLGTTDTFKRVLTVKAIYNSTFGTGLKLNQEFIDIEIVPIEDVT